jgi:hypothetical protein
MHQELEDRAALEVAVMLNRKANLPGNRTENGRKHRHHHRVNAVALRSDGYTFVLAQLTKKFFGNG